MKLDELARSAAAEVRSAARSMPMVPIERVARTRKLALLAPVTALAAIIFVVVALTVLPSEPTLPVVSDGPTPTAPIPTDGSAIAPVADYSIEDLTAIEQVTDQLRAWPWGTSDVEAGRVGSTGPCCLAVGPGGTVYILDQANNKILIVLDSTQTTPEPIRLGEGIPVALAAGSEGVFVLVDVSGTRVLLAYDPLGDELGRIDAVPGDDPQLSISGGVVWQGVTDELSSGPAPTPRRWFPIADATTLEPVAASVRLDFQPLPDGRLLRVHQGVVELVEADGNGMAWIFPADTDLISAHPFGDGVIVTGTIGDRVQYGLSHGWWVRPDGSITAFAFPHYLFATSLDSRMTAVAGDSLFSLGSNEEGLLLSTVALSGLSGDEAALGTIDVSPFAFVSMDQSGTLAGPNGDVIGDNGGFAGSWRRMAWDGDGGVYYIDENGALRQAGPTGDFPITDSLGDPWTVSIVDVAFGTPTFVAISTEFDNWFWIDASTGARSADGPVDRFIWGEGVSSFSAQGLTARIDDSGLANAERDESGAPIGDFELPKIVIEEAGKVISQLYVGTKSQPYLMIHDYDGRRLIVSRFGQEPANPPMTVFFVDFVCPDCTMKIEVGGPTSFSLVGSLNREGPPAWSELGLP